MMPRRPARIRGIFKQAYFGKGVEAEGPVQPAAMNYGIKGIRRIIFVPLSKFRRIK